MIIRILAVSLLSAIPLYSLAQDAHTSENTTIEYYEIESRPDNSQKLSHLKIHSRNEYHADEQDSAPPFPAPFQGEADTNTDMALITL
ncbi:hypothetical protein [Pseudomonas sp. NFX15]|uniref:hypothetical protein n=1 Tax=Pseudomonas sp. NFX15 TaxID=2816958 RepID=UPI003BA07F3E